MQLVSAFCRGWLEAGSVRFKTPMKLPFFLAACLSGALAGFSPRAAEVVRVNEFLASNGGGLADEDGDFSDWIEIFNAGTEPVNLDEWFLTDDPAMPTKWEFPTVSIPAGGYLVVFASGKNRNLPKLHTNFSLGEAGEYLALARPNGVKVTEFAPAYPDQRRDVSYGYDAKGVPAFFTVPTPGGPNGGGVVDFVADTKFSHDRGFYEAPFDLVISTATAGATIRYTTNGVPPTATTGLLYAAPLRISRTTVLRAAAFKTGLQPSNVDTQTYLFLSDVIRQSPNGAPPPGWPSTWGSNAVDYGMDPEVVDHALYRQTIQNDLKTLPSFSIVMRLPDLFDGTTGIYANARQDGVAWERPCSLELIHPDGSDGFQIDAGIRVRGGFSRDSSNPKHAFRFFFRQQYGAGKLNYPLFGKEGADQFDKIDLRTFQNYSWSFQGDGNGVFMRDQWSRDAQLAMGSPAERGNYYHLYINGQYWGLFNTCERPEASYGATYFGGDPADYDTIKTEAGPYTLNATDGNMTAWTALYNLARAGLASDAAYQRVLGNNPDGTPNPAYPVYIDLTNLIDYMLVIIYGGNKDAPISNFLGNESPNNWYGLRNRNLSARMGFQFFAHDAEHTLLPWDLNIDRTGPFPAGDSSVTKSSPQWVWKKLTANAEFRLKVADRVHRHFFNNGLLTRTQNVARFNARRAQIDRAVVGESARWGDAKRNPAFTRQNWLSAVNDVLNNFFPTRTEIVLNQLKGDNLYPSVVAPQFNRHGGNVDAGFVLTMSAPAGEIYYTTDGTDPRLPGGALSGKARRSTGPLVLNENSHVQARVRAGAEWSALNEAAFTIIRNFRELMITEIMYNPPAVGNVDGDEFEFLELKNIGSNELDLSGIRFTNGVDYLFPNGTRLAAGSFYLLVKNATNFASKYPGVRVDGLFTNNLSNSGEAMALVHAASAPIQQFIFDDQPPWPGTADGGGFSLVPRALKASLDYSDAANWRASAMLRGSPGADDPPVSIPPVVIHEILTHTDLPAVDTIELFNPTDSPADISSWFLTDDPAVPAKFKIPAGTVVSPRGFVQFDERHFNPAPGTGTSFTLSSHGEEVHLFSAGADGTLSGYSQGFKFKAAENGVSFGRHTNSASEVLYPAQKTVTPAALNSGPRVGPLVINEIQYQPAPSGDEFIEIKNLSGRAVKLYDPEVPANTWRLAGVDFSFPANAEIPPDGLIVVSGIEPSLFRARYNLPAPIPVFGPFAGNLQDNGELLELLRPDSPDVEPGGAVVVPYIVVDAVRYGARAPWPAGASGTGSSLERISSADFGNDPVNWRASPGASSPGRNNDGNRLPVVSAGLDEAFVSATFPLRVNLAGTATDDGRPDPPKRLTYAWSQVSGPGQVVFDNATQLAAVALLPGVGVQTLRLTVSDGEYTVSDEVTVSVTRPLGIQALVAAGAAWRYLDNGSNQGISWRTPGFSDGTWKTGVSPLGYGDPVTTVIGFGPDGANKYITSYFRHAFTVNGARNVLGLIVKLLRDDGAVVYLNGVEVFRSNMPEGAFDFATLASNVVGGGEETSFFETAVDPARLIEGRNVLAVEVHQQNGGSSDLSFDLALEASVNFANQPPTVSAGPDVTVAQPEATILRGTVGDDGLPNPPGVFSASWSIVSGPGSVTFANTQAPETSATFSQGGEYVLRLGVTDGELNARDDVRVTVTGGDEYALWKGRYFTAAELNNPAIGGDSADPDGDRFGNREEFVAGTDPKDGTSFLHVAAVGRDRDRFVIRFEAAGERSYSILGRASADRGTWERVLDLSPQGTTRTVDALDPLGPSRERRFYRIVTPQQAPQQP